ncbi:MAG: PEGA domain-containing protein [Gallionella sp.]
MDPSLRRTVLIILMFAATGCSLNKFAENMTGGWFDEDDTLHTTLRKSAVDNVEHETRYAASLRVNKYVDLREQANPHMLGISTQRVRGLSGSQLLLDQEIPDLVTSVIKVQFDAEGYQVLEDGNVDDAMFEVSGTIKDLTLNVKYRDEISIAIETTVKNMRSGAVVWSGLVTEAHDRFAGVSGNNKDDIVDYLNNALRVASKKTVSAVSMSLMAAHPELFNLGAKPIPGLSVYSSAAAAEPTSAVSTSVLPIVDAQLGSTVLPTVKVPNAGMFLLNTFPPRAKVYLDGVYYGLSPLRVQKAPGVYAVEVKLKGYRTVTEKVSVRNGDSTEMELNLEP